MWRRRESNPGPKMVHQGVYMFVLSFKDSPIERQQAGFLLGSSD